MKNLFILFLSVPSFLSCNSTVNRIFGDNRTPHEAYAGKVEASPAGQQWKAVSNTILAAPRHVQLPYSLLGSFPAGRPRALALSFTAKKGEWVSFDLQNTGSTGMLIYADVFKKDGIETKHVFAADTNASTFGFEVNETGEYLLRLQPPLEHAGEYTLVASANPSLGFPVAGTKARVGSVWGDSRDGGKRSHEGIDIFAPKRTPVVAAADGYISGVNDGGLGGKTVRMKVSERNLSLYYAHLDEQLVSEGQYVKKGDTLGLVGNTGNAKHTPSHLHFGIYTYGGAVDPLPFVNHSKQKPQPLTAKHFPGPLKLTRAVKTKSNGTVDVNTVLVPLALTSEGYIAELPDGTLIDAPLRSVKPVNATTGS